jgi:hypothetical protein
MKQFLQLSGLSPLVSCNYFKPRPVKALTGRREGEGGYSNNFSSMTHVHDWRSQINI